MEKNCERRKGAAYRRRAQGFDALSDAENAEYMKMIEKYK